MNREFQRNAALIADTLLDPAGQIQVVAVAGGEIAAGLGNADDRTPRLQLLPGYPEIQVALDIERGQIGVFRIVEPGLAAEPRAGILGHGAVLQLLPEG